MSQGLPSDRIYEVAGRADSEPMFPDDPTLPGNRRIAITLLREAPPLRRIAYRLGGVIVPFLLSVRLLRRSFGRPATRPIAARAWAVLIAYCFCWGVGECLGYWFGARGSCEKVY